MAAAFRRLQSLSELSALHRRIAAGIVRELSYAQIAAECAAAGLTCRSEHTVRRHVEKIADRIDLEADFDVLPPRLRVRVWAGRQSWESEHITRIPKAS